MATINEVLNTYVKEPAVSNGHGKKDNHEVTSPVTSKLPTPGKSLTRKAAVERVFEKNSELFHRLAK